MRKLVFAATAALLAVCLCGCAAFGPPAGYTDDTTPDHDGETWVGGR